MYFESTGYDNLLASDGLDQCVKCCVDCDDDDGLVCDRPGVFLDTVEVKSGYWRATSLSTKTYECDVGDECVGGVDTSSRQQCSAGHHGALCGACRSGYDFDGFKFKCVKCGPAFKIASSAGSVAAITLIVVLIMFGLYRRYGSEEHLTFLKRGTVTCLTGRLDPREATKITVALAKRSSRSSQSLRAGNLSDDPNTPKFSRNGGLSNVGSSFWGRTPSLARLFNSADQDDGNVAADKDDDEDKGSDVEGRASPGGSMSNPCENESVGSSETDEQEEARRRRFIRSIMTKTKIVVASYQIASSTQWVLPQINFPDVFSFVLRTANVLGLDFIQLGSTDCIVRLSYFYKLVVVTLFPFALALVGATVFFAWVRGVLATATPQTRGYVEGRVEKARQQAIYCFLLLLYIALPGCSSFTFRYFSCLSFDRGVGRYDLEVLAVDLAIRCTSARYKRWVWYVVLMIFVWPVGFVLGISLLLWRYRHRLDPPLDAAEALGPSVTQGSSNSSNVDNSDERWDDFRRERNRHQTAVNQIRKLELRDLDLDLAKIAFVYEEYEPRAWWFPIFEAIRRIFMTGILTMFFSGSLSQVAIGLLGTMISHRVYSEVGPYIEDDDDVVSEVAQTQLVLIYFAGMVVYTSSEAEKNEGAFSSTAFGVVLVIIFFSSFAVGLWVIMLDAFGESTLGKVAKRTKKRFLETLAPPQQQQQRDSPSTSIDDDDDPDSPSTASPYSDRHGSFSHRFAVQPIPVEEAKFPNR